MIMKKSLQDSCCIKKKVLVYVYMKNEIPEHEIKKKSKAGDRFQSISRVAALETI
jgi:hypothetical protein